MLVLIRRARAVGVSQRREPTTPIQERAHQERGAEGDTRNTPGKTKTKIVVAGLGTCWFLPSPYCAVQRLLLLIGNLALVRKTQQLSI
jgi:hypothetical protein